MKTPIKNIAPTVKHLNAKKPLEINLTAFVVV
jgi:hypothetical protein